MLEKVSFLGYLPAIKYQGATGGVEMTDKGWKPKTFENIFLDIENEDEDGSAYVEYRLEQFKSVEDIDGENLKLIAKRSIQQIPIARRARKFTRAGKQDDEFTKYLVKLFQNFHTKHKSYPRNKEVVIELERQIGQGFINTVNDDTIEWKTGSTDISNLPNRLTKVREILGIARKKKSG